MNRFSPLLLALAVLTLAACTVSSEETILQQIEEANYCTVAEDCVFVGSKCPFGCYIYANTAEATHIQTLVDGFESSCVYSCIQSFGVDCVSNKCEPIVDEPSADPNADGNIGAECTDDTDCVTPMSYLIRSSCPFTSQCIDGSCAVTCPMMEHHTDPTVNESNAVTCEEDSDCSCDQYIAQDMQTCDCVSGECVAIVEQ